MPKGNTNRESLPTSGIAKSYVICGLLLLCMFFMDTEIFAYSVGLSSKESGHPKVTLVLINRLSLDDLLGRENSYLGQMIRQGSIGLQNTRTGGGLTAENAFVTLGAGLRMVGSAACQVALPAGSEYKGEVVGDVYRRYTGLDASADALVVLDIENIKANNLASIGTLQVGTLGETLKKAGKNAAVVGHADNGSQYQRWGALVAMDAEGIVPVSCMQDLTTRDPRFPTGERTDVQALANAYAAVRAMSDFIVVDFGDLDRIEEERRQLAPKLYHSYRHQALADADELFRHIMEEIDLTTEWLLVVSPLPAYTEVVEGRLLAPVAVWGPNISPGLLVSSTTRRRGVIANYDIAYTILEWLNVKPPTHLPGASIIGVENVGDRQSYLGDLLQRSGWTYQQRPPLLRAFVSLEIAVYLTVFGLVIFFVTLPKLWVSFFSFALLLIASIPLALLFIPALKPATISQSFVYTLAAASLITGFVQHFIEDTEIRYAFICGLTALAVVIDALFGGSLIKLSPLGYDVMLGARFYGIGNEYMGILIGASLVAVLVATHHLTHNFLVLMWLPVITFVLAMPNFGANAGGMLTALITTIIVWALTYNISPGKIAITGGLLLAAVLGLNVLPIGGIGSHVGRALKAVLTGDWPSILALVERKAAMNFRLMRYSMWSKGLLVALGVMALSVYRPTAVVQSVLKKYPAARNLVFCTIAASIMALIFNDSGVVAGGTTSVYAAGLILNLILEERREAQPKC
ncbi:MAG: hypothetical protein GX316_03915 [Firmicutes bacterium]|nr:hypothetical protein [Bacillota bacterium]